MSKKQKVQTSPLMTSKRFLPLFFTQALGVLNDNLFKNALAILILYRLAEVAGMNGQLLVTLATGIFIAPFILFSALAGQLADKMEKPKLIRHIKVAEIGVMGLGAIGFFIGNIPFLLFVLFLMGVQSSFFGPVKYSILPDLLKRKELLAGNALIEAGTFLAILVGTILGSLLILMDAGSIVVSALVIGLAVAGVLSAMSIPDLPAINPALKINKNIATETVSILKYARSSRAVFLTIMGISWFWLLGATFLTQFPAFAKDIIGADEKVVTLFLTLFSVGIGLGSILCSKLLKGELSARFVPLGAIGMSIFIIDLFFASSGLTPHSGNLMGITTFLGSFSHIRICFDLLGIAVCGGIYIVPLYAIMQDKAAPKHRSRVIAANNITNSIFIVTGALIAALMLKSGLSVRAVFLSLALGNAIVSIYILGLLPDAILKPIFRFILKLVYKVELNGLGHYKKAGKRAVIVVNHVSFLDAVLLASFLPIKPVFAINTHIAESWWVKPFLKLVDVFPMDPTSAMSAKGLIEKVKTNRHCIIFPEGRITVTGALMKVFEGPGMIADKSNANILPIRIDGAQYTPFSRLKRKVRQRWFPKITITILPPRKFDISDDIHGKERRKMASLKLYDVMSEMMFETTNRETSLFSSMLEARSIHGGTALIAEDTGRSPMSYDRLVLGSFVLGGQIAKVTKRGEYVGMLVPNSLGAIVTFFGLQAYGRVPAMLNFSAGEKNMCSAARTAGLKTILTSRRFVELGDMHDAIKALEELCQIIYLEDIKENIGRMDKITGLGARLFASYHHDRRNISPDEPAVVLFTSGSEGTPKGVVLTHANIIANKNQISSRVDFNSGDIVFNALPIFHSFGLTAGTLLPLLSGVKVFLYPSPLHYRIVPPMVYDTDATILFGTDTFLTGYARVAHPYDFYSLRYVFAGAEKLREETSQLYSDKFGVRILEGYGATEAAPVISVNTPMHYKFGTVGRLMPGMSTEIENVPGIKDGGKLIVSGPNVMSGYMRAENPGELEPTSDNKYDTGDIVSIDDEGFITIKGRAKRFAKLGGEMVSLTAAENLVQELWPDHLHAVVNIPDPKKGEQLLLLTEHKDANRPELIAHAKQSGVPELMVPKNIRVIDEIPLLGTGKIDYVSLAEMSEE